MKKALLLLAVAAVLIWMVLALVAKNANRTAVNREWPEGLGTVDTVPKRFPKQPSTPAALELTRLAGQIKLDQPEVAEYVRAQMLRTDAGIEEPPQRVQSFVVSYEKEIAALRGHLLSGQPIRWPVDLEKSSRTPMPDLRMHMRIHRTLVVSALVRAERGDAGAWDDLRASWALTDGLWPRPELVSSLIGLSIARTTAATARQMPLPVPAWVGEVTAFDYRTPMLRSMQAEAFMMSSTLREIAKPEDDAHWLRRLRDETIYAPYLELSRADLLAHMRTTTTELARIDRCDFDADAFEARRFAHVSWWNQPAKVAIPNIVHAFRRLYRLRAEMELADRALQLRQGRTPSPKSQCSDGTWIVRADRVKFSRAIASANPAMPAMPLEFALLDPGKRSGDGLKDFQTGRVAEY